MYTEQDKQQLKDAVKEHCDKDGWFPDIILGNSIWVLSLCERKMVEGKLYWKFT